MQVAEEREAVCVMHAGHVTSVAAPSTDLALHYGHARVCGAQVDTDDLVA